MIQKRKIDLDIMRIIAISGVIMIHSLGQWSDNAIISVVWKYTTYAVPLFVMISGALWLESGREISIKKIWTKNIFHIVTAFAFWSVVYACIYYKDFGNGKEFIWRCIIGNYHLWYCYMIVGIYILLPILKWIKKNEEVYRYLIVLVFCCSTLLPMIAEFPMTSSIQHILDLLNLSIGNEYVYYFFVGSILYEKTISKRINVLIYLGGVISIILIFVGYFSGGDGSLARIGYTIFIFVLVKNICQKYKGTNGKISYCVGKIAPTCFGIYLVHDVFLHVYNELVVTEFASPYLLAIGKVVFCFVTSYTLVCFIKKIPILGKYII